MLWKIESGGGGVEIHWKYFNMSGIRGDFLEFLKHSCFHVLTTIYVNYAKKLNISYL